MDLQQAAALLNHAGIIDGRMRRLMATDQQAADTIRAWATALTDVPAMVGAVHWDARRAVDRFYEQHGGDRSAQYRSVEPADVLAAWSRCRSELMNRHTDPVPKADPDDPAAYQAELMATRQAVAAGVSPPVQQHQLPGREPTAEIAARVAASGSPIPAHVRHALAPYRALQARRDALAA